MKGGLTVAVLAFVVAAAACGTATTQPPDGGGDDSAAADLKDASASDGPPGDGGAGDGVARPSDSAAESPDDSTSTPLPGDAAATDGGSSDGADAGATCGAGVLREMLCATYCQGIGTLCTGGDAQFASAEECRAICNGPTWACGNQGDTTGNSLFCRVAHMVLAGVGSAAMECPSAGPASVACR
jgi:hypothetical protein